MDIGLYRKSAASGARLGSLSWLEVEGAAHHRRAVDLPGIVEVLPLACRGLVVVDPRPRALELSDWLKCTAARSWRAVVRARRRRAYQLASSWLSVLGRVDARGFKVHCRFVV